ncbi:MAG: hypothetical protein ACE5F9_01795 [Phycisphaerae bacterium]
MNRHECTLDRFTKCTLTALTALLAIIALELWGGRPTTLPAATAQIPDTGRQRQDILIEARKTNNLLVQILDHLRTKAVKVRMEDTDKDPGGKARGGRARRR